MPRWPGAPLPPGLSIRRDAHGVPHVHAATLAQALWGMGYCHARDRGLQMSLMRILGQGRASELLTATDDTLEVDRFFRRMGWAQAAMPAQVRALDQATTTLLRAYCDGANARLLRRPPAELRLLRVRPEPWRIEDCLLLSRMMGYLTLTQSQAEVERLLVQMVQAGVDDERLRALWPHIDELREGGGFDRELLQRVILGERIVPSSLRWLSPMPRMMASNNWVVAPHRSASGHALWANDPHLETNRLPNVWCELAFVVQEPALEVVCATVPGLPAPVVGRSRDLAWGATYAFMDGVDSWVEHCRDGRYRRGDRWQPFRTRTERILRKGKEPVELTFYENDHGVLDGDPHREGHYLCTRWASADSGAQSLVASSGMWTATTVEQGRALLGTIETAWSWVLADRAGSIGYQMSGLLPRRAPGVSGFVPRPGWDPAFDWQGFVPPEQLPRAIDPEAGYLVTANHDLNHLGQAKPINMPMGDYRARRITALLEEASAATVEDMQRIQLDVWSQQAADFMEVLAPLLPDTEAGRRLAAWDLRYTTGSREATLFEAFYRRLYTEVFGQGGLGPAVLDYLWGETSTFCDFYQCFDRVLLAPTSPWHAGRSREDVFGRAFEHAARQPHPPWGEVNQLTFTNIFFAGRLPSWLGFDRGPVPIAGGRATPRQGQIYRSAGRTTSFTPSLRLVADMGERGVVSALAGGPSDRRWSRWYASGVEGWHEGRYKAVVP